MLASHLECRGTFCRESRHGIKVELVHPVRQKAVKHKTPESVVNEILQASGVSAAISMDHTGLLTNTR